MSLCLLMPAIRSTCRFLRCLLQTTLPKVAVLSLRIRTWVMRRACLKRDAEATFQIPDVTKALAFPELLKAYMQPAVVAIASRVERDLLGLYSQFTSNTPLGTAGTPITESVIDSAETALFNAMVPASSPKYLVVDSNSYSAIRQIPRFSEYYSAGEAGLRALVEGNV